MHSRRDAKRSPQPAARPTLPMAIATHRAYPAYGSISVLRVLPTHRTAANLASAPGALHECAICRSPSRSLESKQMTIPAPDHKRYFIEKLGISERLMERCLGEALSAGGDYADLYFESVTSTSLGIDESLVKSASQGISVGCGIRVVSGERTGYAYTDDLSSERLLRAARTAALIADGPAKDNMSGFRHTTDTPSLYPIAGITND